MRLGTRAAVVLGALAALYTKTLAQVYSGGGVKAGVGEASGIGGVAGGDIRSVTVGILKNVVGYTALVAVVVIVIAGIMLLVAGSNDSMRDKAKKIIIYALIGMLVIGLASAIVGFMVTVLS